MIKNPSDCYLKLIRGDCVEFLNTTKLRFDMVLTSPPYDKLRTYNNADPFTFEKFKRIAIGLNKVLKQGGVIVWVVGDATIKGSETLSSFKQALYFKELGLNLHDTMIYKKDGVVYPQVNRYNQSFEYMFIITKGKPKTFNPIKDHANKYAGQLITGKNRNPDGVFYERTGRTKMRRTPKYSMRGNVWKISSGYMKTAKDKIAYEHPAIFPEKLAIDHIKSWSSNNDFVLDPMMGSGTTGKVCKKLKRNFVGIEIDSDYFKIAKQRIAN